MSSEEIGLVPKLRFPEFSEDWEEKKLGDLCKFVRGPFGGALKKDIFVKNGYAVYEQSHAIYDKFDLFRYYITEDKFNELKRFSVLPDDIIMSCSGTMGKFAIVPKGSLKGIINQALLKLTVKKEYDIIFIKINLELPITQEKLLSQSAGGAIKNVVSVDQIKEINLHIPKLQEQTKIANCVSSLDELINLQTEKLKALKKHKKGLMQELFPSEGSTVPKLRFPEFSGDWEKLNLEDNNISLSVKKRIPLKQLNLETYISTENLISNYGGVVIASKLPPSGSFTEFKKGDILISNIRPYLKKVWIADKDGTSSNDIIVIRAQSEITELFLSFLLMNDEFIEYVMKGAKGVKMPRGDISLIMKYPIVFPTIKEQQKIANCLSSLDELINLQSKKIALLKEHKKGMMQQLFPSIEEIEE